MRVRHAQSQVADLRAGQGGALDPHNILGVIDFA